MTGRGHQTIHEAVAATEERWTRVPGNDPPYRQLSVTIRPGNGAHPFSFERTTRRSVERETALLKAQYPMAMWINVEEES